MKNIFFIIICSIILAGCDDGNNQISNNIPRFELHRTENIFTSLLLDSRTGRLWQIQFTLNNKQPEGAIPLSTEKHANDDGVNGRFTLTATPNFWTFLLTDTMTGAIWHCQFSLKQKDYHGCYAIVLPSTNE